MIVIATSGANNCLYCVVSHGTMLRVYSKHTLLGEQIAINYHKADITARQRVMLDFSMKVALESAKISDTDFATLREHGFND